MTQPWVIENIMWSIIQIQNSKMKYSPNTIWTNEEKGSDKVTGTYPKIFVKAVNISLPPE